MMEFIFHQVFVTGALTLSGSCARVSNFSRLKAITYVVLGWIAGSSLSCTQSKEQLQIDQPEDSTFQEVVYQLGEPQILAENTRTLTSSSFSKPVWSPDGDKILFTKVNNQGLYVINFEKPDEIQTLIDLPGAGRKANWSKDSEHIFFISESSDSRSLLPVVQSVEIGNKSLTDHPNYQYPVELNSAKSLTREAYFVFTNPETLQIEATNDAEDGETWVITPDQGSYYYPILSPDRVTVIVHEGAFMYTYASDGSGRIDSLGVGQATGWSPDSQYILYFVDEGDGHQITKSDLFICRADGSFRQKLTNTDDIVEMWAAWSPKGDRIAYSDDKSGKIMIADLK